jgi:TrmH family RNA methyltransferase
MADRLSKRRRRQIASLTARKNRKRRNQTLVESRRALRSAVDAGAPLVDVVATPEALKEADVQALLARANVPVYVAEADVLDRLTAVETHQGLVGVVERHLVDADALPDRVGDAGTLLALDRVQDPGNVGTILRTAAWFGADALVAGAGTAGLYGPKVMRAAAGGHWDLALARAPALGPLLDRLRRAGHALYGADLQGTGAAAWRPGRPSTLVLGSEAHGLSAAALDRLDTTVALPGAAGRRGAESLNVAVASGILVYEWLGRASA